MKSARRHLDSTRRAILDALAHVIVESTGFGFSVQDVANRAGVTHRTVYNHFPTRDALSDALAEHVETLFSSFGPDPSAPLPSLQTFAAHAGELYRGLATQEVHVRAYVMLMMANRRPSRVMRLRSQRFEEVVARDAVLPAGLTALELTAVIRMFVSSMGWHTLTEHLGLSLERAATAATWATSTLVNALEMRAAPSPHPGQKSAAKARRKALPPRQARPKEKTHGRRTRKSD